ncbi:MAG TPA: SRPBCC domain-containing protein [Thermoanaerobaculia bacterium]
MSTPQQNAPISLRMTRTFDAPRERVFQAWTEPEALAKWFAPTAEFQTRIPKFELRVGGAYRIEMQLGDKNNVVVGTYKEIRPPQKLVFTWRWETAATGGDTGDTLVTLEFTDRGGRTELALIHERFASTESRDAHDKGWIGCFDRLQKYVA